MKLNDFLDISVGNLGRMKLRAILTISGVVIAIAAFVALLSFGAGNQKLVESTYNDLGLFTSMKVYPVSSKNEADTTHHPDLNKEAITQLSEIPGVLLAFPYMSFDITAEVLDTVLITKARALPEDAFHTKLFTNILGGQEFSSDTAKEAILTHKFIEMLGIDNPDTLVGRKLIISTTAMSLDSALINVIDDKNSKIWKRFREIRFDSLFEPDYRNRVMSQELNEGLRRFTDGLMNRKLTISDTLLIVGVGSDIRKYSVSLAPVIIPDKTARRLSEGGLGLGSDPMDLFAAMRSGKFFTPQGTEESRLYPQVTLEIDPYASYETISDSVKALGFRAFSYAEEFKNVRRFFLFFNMGLGALGLIALVTASLGIVNTMVMSITERRREIGIVKSLGADERAIKLMFLAESAVIGAFGSILGILVGWLGTRVATVIAHIIMEKYDIPEIEIFALPLWLILLAFVFGVVVSLLAGIYPASRAARVDPVQALRSE